MARYYVSFGTGAGDYESDLELSELTKQVSNETAYTQESIRILDNHIKSSYTEDKIVATLPWHGCEYDGDDDEKEDEVVACYGRFGYYGQWVY